jgi:FxLD family lantipeptide
MTMATPTLAQPADTSGALDLDVSIVERGDAVDALLCSTDNGCNTKKGQGGDC